MASPSKTAHEHSELSAIVASADALPPAGKQAATRFTAIDGMRGISAMWIALSHFYTALLPSESARPWGEALHLLLSHHYLGYVGIHIFFVLSGFVIARNFYQLPVTFGLVGRFALRRSIRLDPTYWIMILITLGLESIKSEYSLGTARTWGVEFSAAGFVANLFYLNDLLGYRPIVNAGWTLCLEIQFYLVFALLEWLHYQSSRRFGIRVGWYRGAWFAPFFLWSVLVYYLLPTGHAPTIEGLFIEYWFEFFLGVMAWWTLAGITTWKWTLICQLLLIAAIFLASDPSGFQTTAPDDYQHTTGACAAIVASLTISLLGARGLLTNGLSGPVFQFLGRISYSLYLIHPLAGNRALRLLLRQVGGAAALGQIGVIAAFWGAIALSIIAAYGLYALVERPTHRLSRRISLVGGA